MSQPLFVHKGRLITLEGVECSGKSTQAKRLGGYLEAQGKQVLLTREPGGTPEGEQIRQIFLADSENPMPAKSELLLMFAARFCHIENKILPALERGDWVVCERFTDSTFAYQGGGRGLDSALITLLENNFIGCFAPDLTFLIDLPIKISLERKGNDRIEQEGEEFFTRTRDAYLKRARKFPQRIKVLNGSKSVDEITKEMLATLQKCL